MKANKVDYKQMSDDILQVVGYDKISKISHCTTRLRLVLENNATYDAAKIEAIPGVKGVFFYGGQLQIIIGSGVSKLFEFIPADKKTGLTEVKTANEKKAAKVDEDGNKIKFTIKDISIKKGIRSLADVFVGIIPAIAATGLFMGLKGIFTNDIVLGWFGTSSANIPEVANVVISVITDTAFAFLPALLCWSVFKKCNATPVIGFVIGLMLVNPMLPNAYSVASGDVEPYWIWIIPIIGYQGSILTALFVGLIGAQTEKALRKVMPNSLDIMFTPFLTILAAIVSGLFVLGPILHYIEELLVIVFTYLIKAPAGIGGIIFGFIYPFSVLIGMHHLFIIIETALLANTGFNPVITVCAMYGFANAAVAFGVAIRTKNKQTNVIASSAGFTQLLGISEPALFGVTIRNPRLLWIMVGCSSLGGFVLSMLGIQANGMGLAVCLSPLMYTYSLYQLLTYVLVGIGVFALAITLTIMFGFKENVDANKKFDMFQKIKERMTRKSRYKHIDQLTEKEETDIKQVVDASKFRQFNHIQTTMGLMNDPNGFAYYNGEYHLFYQWYPYAAKHGLKNWYHVKSKDLISWENVGLGIKPEFDHESHGIFSGTGLVEKDKLMLFYTGNKRDKKWNRLSSQCLAIMDKDGTITKKSEPIIASQPEGYTSNFRDPKVFKRDGMYWMFVGSQTKDKKGCVLVYKSADAENNWELAGELKINSEYQDFGNMIECPDLITIDKKDVLLLSLEGAVETEFTNKNSHNNIYLLGELDLNKLEFNASHFDAIDSGFDFYAAQTCTNGKENYLVSWLGLPGTTYPSDKDKWSGCLSLIKKLSIKDNSLNQNFIKKQFDDLRILKPESFELENEEKVIDLEKQSGSFEINITEIEHISGFKIINDLKEEISLLNDFDNGLIKFDRSKLKNQFAENHKQFRDIQYSETKVNYKVVLDNSSIEIIINDGQKSFTSRVFKKADFNKLVIFSNFGKAKFELS